MRRRARWQTGQMGRMWWEVETETSIFFSHARASFWVSRILNNHFTFAPKSHSHHQNPIRDDEKTIFLGCEERERAAKDEVVQNGKSSPWFMCSKQILHMLWAVCACLCGRRTVTLSTRARSLSTPGTMACTTMNTRWIQEVMQKCTDNADYIFLKCGESNWAALGSIRRATNRTKHQQRERERHEKEKRRMKCETCLNFISYLPVHDILNVVRWHFECEFPTSWY